MNFPIHLQSTKARSRSRWQGRDVFVTAGTWSDVRAVLPHHRKEDFVAFGHEYRNPHLRAVVRQPLQPYDSPIAVATVGRDYGLVTHPELGHAAVQAMNELGVFLELMPCSVELTEFGEWAHFQFVLGDQFALVPPDTHPICFCVDLYNSVDGSSRLVMTTSWKRLICDNGLIARETSDLGLSRTHDRHVDLAPIRPTLAKALQRAKGDAEILKRWWTTVINHDLALWADMVVTPQWGKSAAARVLSICTTGCDGEAERFSSASASSLRIYSLSDVPGAPEKAETLYDISQALSWVAGTAVDVNNRRKCIADIPLLLARLEHQAHP